MVQTSRCNPVIHLYLSLLSPSQLLVFNSLENRRKNATTNTTRPGKHRQTPLLVYLGVKIHTKTRKREIVDTLFHLGLSISYDRELNISTELGNEIYYQYEMEKAVCPLQLKSGLFTTAAADNIDHNFQHPDKECSGFKVHMK